MRQKQIAIVASQREMSPGIYDMWIESSLAKEARPGQFLCIYPKDRSTLLPRPISICEVREDGKALRIVYRVVGHGTEEFSRYAQGESISILGNLGNGFPVDRAAGRKVFLMGGGIGIPPMLQLAKELNRVTDRENIRIIVGYRDADTFLREDLERYGRVFIATEDGSVGTRGNVLDAIRKNDLSAELICACGPMPMLRAVKGYAGEQGIPAYISLEEHMACGVGACLGCVVKTKEKDAHSHVHNARICTEGPVFEAREVDI
ncbi:MAG: dihydroorotate dehydrogenase electron transfer subunit [Clostridium sp.]|nr:dihydroorotate dehydrogenase electron transfer subunit [Acetatifactor muris]MCM1528205.1 dihydroorotate dehydrogenase electron transfer subunit [Bacteroides sp.]MCM1564300.1 dihydroorotate dehydrogenase electron transfer subunit [Clostridium sp.]